MLKVIIELCRISPMMIIFIPFIIGGLSQDTIWLLMGVGSIINFGCNGIFKLISKSLLKNYSFIYRPDGAIQCSDYLKCGATEPATRLGMPSGHSQAIGFVVGFIIYRKLYRNQSNKTLIERVKGNKSTVVTCILLLFIIMYSRLGNNLFSADIVGCHTPLQTVVGATLGFMIGFNYHKLIDKLKL